MKKAKILFFDVGYTLINEDDVWIDRCRKQAATAEARERGLTYHRIYQEIVIASIGHKPPYRTAMQKLGLTDVVPYSSALEKLYPYTIPVLDNLAQKYRLGIIANQAHGLQQRLKQEGIAHYFSVVVSSADCGAAKPEPKIFELALQRAQCAPHEAVMIGDRLDNDIYPAKKLGMKTIWVRQGFGGMQSIFNDDYRPTTQIALLSELNTIL